MFSCVFSSKQEKSKHKIIIYKMENESDEKKAIYAEV